MKLKYKWVLTALVFLTMLTGTSAFSIQGDPGIQSGDLPEKYGREIVFTLPKELVVEMLTNDKAFGNGEWFYKNFIAGDFDREAGSSFGIFAVDGKENLYLSFSESIKVFDKSGKLIRTISNADHSDGLVVDEDGDLALIGGMQLYIYDSGGKLSDEKKFDSTSDKSLEFSNGVLYSSITGKVFYQMQKATTIEKNIHDVIERKPDELGGYRYFKNEGKDEFSSPKIVDGYLRSGFLTADYSKNLYFNYGKVIQPDEGRPWTKYRVYKVDLSSHLLTMFDFYNITINRKTQSVYHLELNENGLFFVRWKKSTL